MATLAPYSARVHGWTRRQGLQFFNRDLVVSEDANLAGDTKRLLRYFPRGKSRVLHQGARRGQCVGASAANGCNPLIRLNHIAGAAEQISLAGVGDD